MKTGLIVLIVILLVFMGGCSTLVGKYNSMVNQDEAVKTAWSQVENVYQRRADLIPNLVNVVKGYAAHEQGTLTAVIEARSKASAITIDPSKATPAQLKAFTDAQGELSSALSRLMVVVEQYPNLKANENFMALQSQLEGTENRIAVERKRFNETAQGYNTYIRRFPNNILAGMFGFQSRAYFEADKGANKAPEVKF
jgi:LemA protein